MNQLKNFWESLKKEEIAVLATSGNDKVTMRTVSPVYHEDAVLIFTDPLSQKYRQLKENPNCCLSVCGCFMEAKAEFLGHTMLNENAALRKVYTGKHHDAFDENVEFGGTNAEFILLKPVCIKGWVFENGIPTVPFECNF